LLLIITDHVCGYRHGVIGIEHQHEKSLAGDPRCHGEVEVFSLKPSFRPLGARHGAVDRLIDFEAGREFVAGARLRDDFENLLAGGRPFLLLSPGLGIGKEHGKKQRPVTSGQAENHEFVLRQQEGNDKLQEGLP
jgi:hypothetical protein